MEWFSAIDSLNAAASLVGLSVTRLAVAFLLLPIFSSDIVPALVRNAVFVALALLVLALQPLVNPTSWSAMQWLSLFIKEALLGVALGFGMAAFLWAFSAAGQIVDTKVGASNMQLTDPLSGQQMSISGTFLSRLSGYLFMVSGGFTLFIGVVIDSFRLWPLMQLALHPKRAGVLLFELQLSSFMSLAFLIAAPVLVVTFAIDLVLGLINRYAPQLNLSAVSASFKGLAAVAVWLLMLGNLMSGFSYAMKERIGAVLPDLMRILGMN